MQSIRAEKLIHPGACVLMHGDQSYIASYITAWRNHPFYEESKGCAKPMIAISTQPFFYTAFYHSLLPFSI